MKSFRHIAIFLGLAALLAGCVRAEIVDAPEREITFSVGSYEPATKASAVTEFTSFKSKAFLHAEGINTTQNFFGDAGETISLRTSGLNNEWVPSHPYYWPKSAQSYINFVSWYDRNSNPTTVSETSLVWANRTIVPNDNILWADEAWRFNDNVSPATYGSVSGTVQGIPTLFHHALAQVQFRAKATTVSDGNTSWSISITNFRVTGVRKTGTLSLVNEDPASNTVNEWWSMSRDATPVATDPYWDLTGSAADTLSHTAAVNITTANTPVCIMATRSVIPQETAGLVLSCDCNIRTSYADNSYMVETVPVTVNISDFVGDTGAWAMNHRMTYTLSINPLTGKILFDPALSDGWAGDMNNSMYVE